MLRSSSPVAKWVAVPVILCFGLLIRVLYVLKFQEQPVFDFPCGPDIGEYWREANAILVRSNIVSGEQIHGPLYSHFLALLLWCTGKNLFLTRLIQSVIVLFSGLTFVKVLSDRFRDEPGIRPWIPPVFFALYALYPPFVVWQCDFYCENLLPLLYGCAILFLHLSDQKEGWKRYALTGLAGFFASLAGITHPLSYAFAAGCALVLLCRAPFRKSLLRTCIFSFAVLIVLFTVSYVRSCQAGHPVLIQQNSAFNLWLGNNAEAKGTCYIPPGDEWDRIHETMNEEDFRRDMRHFILHHPFRWTLLLCSKALMSFYPTELTTWSDTTCLRGNWVHVLARYPFFLLFALPGLTTVMICLTRTEFRRKYDWFLVLFFAGWLVQILTLTSGRYRMPVTLSLMAFAPFVFTLERKSRHRYPKVFAAILICCSMLVYQTDFKKEMDVAHAILGEAYMLKGEPYQAEMELLHVISPNTSVLNNLGRINTMNQRIYDAKNNFETALKLYPDHPVSLLNLGTIYEMEGDIDAALKLYLRAAERGYGQTASDAWFNAGTIYCKKNDLKKAMQCYSKSRIQDPLSVKPLRNMAWIKLQENDPAAAEAYLKDAVRLAPDDPQRKKDLEKFHQIFSSTSGNGCTSPQ